MDPLDVSRARLKGSESNLFSSLSQRDSSRHPRELQGPGEPGRSSRSPPGSGLGTINISLLRGDEGAPPSSSGQSGLVLQREELVQMPSAELGLWICDLPEDWSV